MYCVKDTPKPNPVLYFYSHVSFCWRWKRKVSGMRMKFMMTITHQILCETITDSSIHPSVHPPPQSPIKPKEKGNLEFPTFGSDQIKFGILVRSEVKKRFYATGYHVKQISIKTTCFSLCCT